MKSNANVKTWIILVFAVMMTVATKAFSYSVEVEDISREKYFPQVKQGLSQAEERQDKIF